MVLENVDVSSLGVQMGGSAIIGAVIGFAAKKIAKVIAVLVGLQLILFKFLESRGVISVNWNRLTDQSSTVVNDGAAAGQTLIEAFVTTAGIGASFAGGFLLGFKKA